jgi:hypothetical protein
VTGDVFENNKSWPNSSDDPGDVGPQVALVRGSEPLPGDAERLAWVARRDDIHNSTPRLRVEGSQVVPDRSRTQVRSFHPRHEAGRSEGVPLDQHHRLHAEGPEPEVEPADPGAEGEGAQHSHGRTSGGT